jgi:hypothetical protein
VLLTVTDDDLYLYITAQDQVEIYFDNQPQDINKDDIAKKWQSVKVVKIPRGTRVLSVKATNLGKNPGLLASITGDRLLSDSNWKVLGSTPSNDWTSVSYNDNQWKNARVKAPSWWSTLEREDREDQQQRQMDLVRQRCRQCCLFPRLSRFVNDLFVRSFVCSFVCLFVWSHVG